MYWIERSLGWFDRNGKMFERTAQSVFAGVDWLIFVLSVCMCSSAEFCWINAPSNLQMGHLCSSTPSLPPSVSLPFVCVCVSMWELTGYKSHTDRGWDTAEELKWKWEDRSLCLAVPCCEYHISSLIYLHNEHSTIYSWTWHQCACAVSSLLQVCWGKWLSSWICSVSGMWTAQLICNNSAIMQ